MLACYRKNCAQATTPGQLILPETLKLLPVYVSSLIKSDALTGSKFHLKEEKTSELTSKIWSFSSREKRKRDFQKFNTNFVCFFSAQTVTTDDRSWLMQRILSMNIKGTFAYLYPRVYALVNWTFCPCLLFFIRCLFQHTLDENQLPPPMIRCSYERFSEIGAYVIGKSFCFHIEFEFRSSFQLENGLVMYIWLGSQVNPTFLQSLFGLQSVAHLQPEKVRLKTKNDFNWKSFVVFQCRIVELDNPISRNVRNLLSFIRNERNSFLKVRQNTFLLEQIFKIRLSSSCLSFNNATRSNRFSKIILSKTKVLRVARPTSIFFIICIEKFEIFFNKKTNRSIFKRFSFFFFVCALKKSSKTTFFS